MLNYNCYYSILFIVLQRQITIELSIMSINQISQTCVCQSSVDAKTVQINRHSLVEQNWKMKKFGIFCVIKMVFSYSLFLIQIHPTHS